MIVPLLTNEVRTMEHGKLSWLMVITEVYTYMLSHVSHLICQTRPVPPTVYVSRGVAPHAPSRSDSSPLQGYPGSGSLGRSSPSAVRVACASVTGWQYEYPQSTDMHLCLTSPRQLIPHRGTSQVPPHAVPIFQAQTTSKTHWSTASMSMIACFL